MSLGCVHLRLAERTMVISIQYRLPSRPGRERHERRSCGRSCGRRRCPLPMIMSHVYVSSLCFIFMFHIYVSCLFFAFPSRRRRAECERSPLEDLPQQLLACVATLGVLCRASPAFLAPHLHCLLPYLKGENGLTAAEESEICRQVCTVWVCHLWNLLMGCVWCGWRLGSTAQSETFRLRRQFFGRIAVDFPSHVWAKRTVIRRSNTGPGPVWLLP